jgi:hypothetical protein
MANKGKRQDFYPNYMSWSLTQGGNDAFVTDKIFTPIPRNQVVTGNKATVMELLWFEIVCHNLTLNNGGEYIVAALSTGPVPTAATLPELDNGNCLCYVRTEIHLLTSGASVHVQPGNQRYYFQSSDGYGVLLASDTFHASLDSFNTGVANHAHLRLYYRFVQVPVSEYIGIVQSQQSS